MSNADTHAGCRGGRALFPWAHHIVDPSNVDEAVLGVQQQLDLLEPILGHPPHPVLGDQGRQKGPEQHSLAAASRKTCSVVGQL